MNGSPVDTIAWHFVHKVRLFTFNEYGLTKILCKTYIFIRVMFFNVKLKFKKTNESISICH
jgi:hypothetical protein